MLDYYGKKNMLEVLNASLAVDVIAQQVKAICLAKIVTAVARQAHIELKSPREIELLKQAGHVGAEILMQLKRSTTAGMTTRDVDALAAKLMKERDVKPAFLNYRGYPAVVCTSVNEEVVHSIPGSRRLKDGDILSLDIGIFLNSYCGDTATSFAIGARPLRRAERLMKAGRESLEASIRRRGAREPVRRCVLRDAARRGRSRLSCGSGVRRPWDRPGDA